MGGVVELVCPVWGFGKALDGLASGLRSLLTVSDHSKMVEGRCVRCLCDYYSPECFVLKCEDCCNLGYVLEKLK